VHAIWPGARVRAAGEDFFAAADNAIPGFAVSAVEWSGTHTVKAMAAAAKTKIGFVMAIV
jgi:hypothetical protein